jgi:hypothetical protein
MPLRHFNEVTNNTFNAMAGGVYDWQDGDLSPRCHSWDVVPCPADATGSHSVQAMSGTLVAEFVGDTATQPAVDGLAPAVIRHVKAHSVAWWVESNWSTHQRGTAHVGDTRSYGGVLFEIRTGRGDERRILRFIVAFSGADPWKDQQLAYLVGHAIWAELVDDGYLVPDLPFSTTFILGANPDDVAALVAATSS